MSSKNKNDSLIKVFWSKLDPKSKKKISVMSIALAVILVALGGYYTSHHVSSQQQTSNNEEEKAINITLQPGILQKNINNKVNRKLSYFEKQLQRLQQQLKEQKLEAKHSNPQTTNNQQTSNKHRTPNKPLNKLSPAYSVPPPPPASGYPQGLSSSEGGQLNKKSIQAQPEIIGSIGVAANPEAQKGASASVKKKKTTSGVYLPPSFMQASLLSGLDAPTMNGAQSNPVPVLLRVRAPAILPNRVRANLKGCFIIAEGVGNLASERVMLRLVSLSCIAKDGHAVIDQPVKGFVVGSDGKIGLRGRVASKMGALLARAALAGFLTGFGNALNSSSWTTWTSSVGTSSALNSGEIGRAALGSGVAAAAKKLADFYMKLADQTLPVIEVGATRRVTVVISKGVMLKIKDVCIGGEKCSE